MIIESIKMSKKDLKQLAHNLSAIKGSGNVYNFENDIYYLQRKDFENIKNDYMKIKVLEELKDFISDEFDLYIYQIAYCSGIYGNTGQLYKVAVMNRDLNNIKRHTFYTYYC